MYLTVLSAALAVTLVAGQGSLDQWEPAGPNDARGPCPMLNTLANHGFLPHDGLNFTRDVVVNALTGTLNFDEPMGILMFENAVRQVNPDPNGTFFDLNLLSQHNFMEHDSSLSRSDAFFGDQRAFNQTIFDGTKSFWTAPVLDAKMLAHSKVARQFDSYIKNPEYTFTAATEGVSVGEVAAPILIFGDIPGVSVDRAMVEFFFENERLPVELGWVKQAIPIDINQVTTMSNIIANASSLITLDKLVNVARDMHFGLGLKI